MAFLRFNDHVLASSNLKDIKKYCEANDITFLTTMDLLCEALRTSILTEEECNLFIEKVLTKGSKLPCRIISEYANAKYLE